MSEPVQSTNDTGAVFGRGQDDRFPPAVLTLRPIGNPLTMGLVGLAVATFVMSGLELGWYDGERLQTGIILAIVGPLLQSIAAVIAFQARDSVAATALGVQAATWLTIGVVTATSHGSSDALGTALFIAGIAVIATGWNAARYKGLLGLVIVTTGVRWLLSGLSQTSGADFWGDIAAIVGIVLCAMALLAATVGEVEEETSHPLPLSLRRSRGQRVFHPAAYDHQTQAATDPGARDLL